MMLISNRRTFVKQVASLGLLGRGLGVPATTRAADLTDLPTPPEHTIKKIGGSPRERGLQYGRMFKDPIAAFLDREIISAFQKSGPTTHDAMLRYAGACGKEVRSFSPVIWDELEGLSEGAGLRVEDALLITLHEELYHRGVLPSVDHCTVAAAGPPETKDGHSYIGQTWDWMPSVYGLSNMLHWERPRSEGPSLLSYAYPGLWVGAGLNSAGIGLCWTSANDREKIAGPKIGIPSYVLLTQLLYQETLDAVVEEARRAPQAGWFTFVLADAAGQIVNVEGSPKELAIERFQGHLGRHQYGTRKMTRTPDGMPARTARQGLYMDKLLASASGKIDPPTLQAAFADHQYPICSHRMCVDAMLFDLTAKEALVTRGPACSNRWKKFTFSDA
jgi:isopenicillin-N N-acyltransferase-like protein